MLDGDLKAVEKFIKEHSDYGPLMCAFYRIKKAAKLSMEAKMEVKHFIVSVSDLPQNVINERLQKLGLTAEAVISITPLGSDNLAVFYRQ